MLLNQHGPDQIIEENDETKENEYDQTRSSIEKSGTATNSRMNTNTSKVRQNLTKRLNQLSQVSIGDQSNFGTRNIIKNGRLLSAGQNS
jgi:predicted secreted Zn-dependent protease